MECKKKGFLGVIGKTKSGKFILSGFALYDKKNETANAIDAVIAKYGYTQGFLDVYDLVDAAFVHIHNKPEGTKLQLLIDGSGSMSSGRRNSAMISSVILHEVLKKQGIQHAIVEHRQILRKSDGKIPILALQ